MSSSHPRRRASPAGQPRGVYAELRPFLRLSLAAACVYALLGELVPAAAALAAFAAGTAAALRADSRRRGVSPLGGRLAEFGKIYGRSLAAAGTVLFAGSLLADAFHGGLAGRTSVLDSLLASAACAVFLIPLGLPLGLLVLLGRSRSAAAAGEAADTLPREIESGAGWLARFHLTCALGMSASVYGAVLAGWLTPLTYPQVLWAGLAGTALPGLAAVPGRRAPAAGTYGSGRPFFSFTDALETAAAGFLLGFVLLAVFRLGLGWFRGLPEAAARSRSLAFLTLCIAQALAPIFAPPVAPAGSAGSPIRIPALAARLGTVAAGAGLTAALFLSATMRRMLGLSAVSAATWLPAAAAAAVYSLGAFAGRSLLRRLRRV